MTHPTARRAGGPIRRTRPVRRASAGLTPGRAGAALALLVSAAAIYGLAASSAFGFARLEIEGATITTDEVVRSRLALPRGLEPLRDHDRTARGPPSRDPGDRRCRDLDRTARIRSPCASRSADRSSSGSSATRRLLVDATGLLFAETDATPPASLGRLPVISDSRSASASFRVGAEADRIDPVDLDVARRLASLTPAQVGSGSSGLRVRSPIGTASRCDPCRPAGSRSSGSTA